MIVYQLMLIPDIIVIINKKQLQTKIIMIHLINLQLFNNINYKLNKINMKNLTVKI